MKSYFIIGLALGFSWIDLAQADSCQRPPDCPGSGLVLAPFDPVYKPISNACKEYYQCVSSESQPKSQENALEEDDAPRNEIGQGQSPEFGDCLYRCALSNSENPNACIGYCVNGGWSGGAPTTTGILPGSSSSPSPGPGISPILVPSSLATIQPDVQLPRSLPSWDRACLENPGNPLCIF